MLVALILGTAASLAPPLLAKLAIDSGAAITSEIELFLSACPARVAGVTGSNGKSSTATMLALGWTHRRAQVIADMRSRAEF